MLPWKQSSAAAEGGSRKLEVVASVSYKRILQSGFEEGLSALPSDAATAGGISSNFAGLYCTTSNSSKLVTGFPRTSWARAAVGSVRVSCSCKIWRRCSN